MFFYVSVAIIALASAGVFMYLEGSDYRVVKRNDKFVISKKITFLSPEYYAKPNAYSSSYWQRNINKAILFDTKDEAEKTIRKLAYPNYF